MIVQSDVGSVSDSSVSRSPAVITQVIGRRNFVGLAALCAAGVAGLTSCDDETRKAETRKADSLSFGFTRNPISGAIAYMQEKGLFAAQGLKLSLVPFIEGGGPKILQAMSSGDVEMGLVNSTPMVFAVAQEALPLQVVSVPTNSAPGFAIVSHADITKVSDLAGKRVSTPSGTIHYYFLVQALAKFDMTLKDIDWVELSAGDAQAAFLSGKLDAVVPSNNGKIFILANGGKDVHVLFAYQDFGSMPGDPKEFIDYDVLVTPKRVAEKNGDAVTKFLHAYHKHGVPLITDPKNRSEVVDYINDYQVKLGGAKEELDAIAKQMDGIDFLGYKAASDLVRGSFSAGLQSQAEFWMKLGAIPTVPNFGEAVNTSAL